MSKVTVFGHSDDCIEIEGSIRHEFYADENGNYIAFSDGTVLHVEYAKNGIWRILRVEQGSASMEKIEATDPDGDYTDRVTLSGDIKWMVGGCCFKSAKL